MFFSLISCQEWNNQLYKLWFLQATEAPHISLVQFSKFNNFLWVCWFLCENFSNLVYPIWKLHNLLCHMYTPQWLQFFCNGLVPAGLRAHAWSLAAYLPNYLFLCIFWCIPSDVVSGWAGWALAHPEFGVSVYPITTGERGANYAHCITACPSGFKNLMASLVYCTKRGTYCDRALLRRACRMSGSITLVIAVYLPLL